MRLQINMNLDNAAFENDWQVEAIRIINNFFDEKPEAGTERNLRDANGNVIGVAIVK